MTVVLYLCLLNELVTTAYGLDPAFSIGAKLEEDTTNRS